MCDLPLAGLRPPPKSPFSQEKPRSCSRGVPGSYVPPLGSPPCPAPAWPTTPDALLPPSGQWRQAAILPHHHCHQLSRDPKPEDGNEIRTWAEKAAAAPLGVCLRGPEGKGEAQDRRQVSQSCREGPSSIWSLASIVYSFGKSPLNK